MNAKLTDKQAVELVLKYEPVAQDELEFITGPKHTVTYKKLYKAIGSQKVAMVTVDKVTNLKKRATRWTTGTVLYFDSVESVKYLDKGSMFLYVAYKGRYECLTEQEAVKEYYSKVKEARASAL